MPPADAKKQLTDAEREILNRWVKQGGEYGQHWAFVVPSISADENGTKSVDDLVIERLESEGLKPSPQADRRTLIRRVTLDLTGLPPAPDQIDRFLRNPASDQVAFTN